MNGGLGQDKSVRQGVVLADGQGLNIRRSSEQARLDH